MKGNASLFRFEQNNRTLILSPTRDLSELELLYIDDIFRVVLQKLELDEVLNVVFDFHATEYYGSTALGLFITLWKRVREAGGQMVFCNLSSHEREILELTHLDRLWMICPSRDEAMATLA